MNAAPDLNTLMAEVIELAREARRLARRGRNEVAVASADHFEQGAATAYRNQDRAVLNDNLAAARLLVHELRARASVS